ncbi:hypothetical protein JOL62DRAFT_346707 [Phyllosticta paracitricarpa]|uniref:Transmembrane protein n=1 Tax=Phyllosticta paracitricarpa TaxID=2016321 RepID=A0ABR1NFC7_9PEZI
MSMTTAGREMEEMEKGRESKVCFSSLPVALLLHVPVLFVGWLVYWWWWCCCLFGFWVVGSTSTCTCST